MKGWSISDSNELRVLEADRITSNGSGTVCLTAALVVLNWHDIESYSGGLRGCSIIFVFFTVARSDSYIYF